MTVVMSREQYYIQTPSLQPKDSVQHRNPTQTRVVDHIDTNIYHFTLSQASQPPQTLHQPRRDTPSSPTYSFQTHTKALIRKALLPKSHPQSERHLSQCGRENHLKAHDQIRSNQKQEQSHYKPQPQYHTSFHLPPSTFHLPPHNHQPIHKRTRTKKTQQTTTQQPFI